MRKSSRWRTKTAKGLEVWFWIAELEITDIVIKGLSENAEGTGNFVQDNGLFEITDVGLYISIVRVICRFLSNFYQQ